jgi:integrase
VGRDFALLLLMVTYGLGAGEVIGLTLEDIDWRAGTLRVTRPKTAASVVLPLLPPVARALVRYLRHGRPAATRHRQLFVRMRAPYRALSGSSAVRHVVVTHARAAGLSALYLGSHVLRHSHATQQINTGAPVRVVADILGHRRPESTSTYARVALDRLRPLALPVPSWR